MNYSFKTARSKAHLYSWDGSLPYRVCSLWLRRLYIARGHVCESRTDPIGSLWCIHTAECNQMGIEISVDQSSTENWSSPQNAVTELGTCMLHLYLKVLWMLQNMFASLACRPALLWVDLLQTQVQKVSLFSSKGRCKGNQHHHGLVIFSILHSRQLLNEQINSSHSDQEPAMKGQ